MNVCAEPSTHLLALGSNAADKERAVAEAARFVGTLGEIVADSGAYLTPPEGTPPDAAPYWNRILSLRCPLTTPQLHRLCKDYESAKRLAHRGPGVAIDIDIVADAGGVLRPKDYASHYFRIGLEKLKTNILQHQT